MPSLVTMSSVSSCACFRAQAIRSVVGGMARIVVAGADSPGRSGGVSVRGTVLPGVPRLEGALDVLVPQPAHERAGVGERAVVGLAGHGIIQAMHLGEFRPMAAWHFLSHHESQRKAAPGTGEPASPGTPDTGVESPVNL